MPRSSLPPRGSARFYNLQFKTALQRGKEQIDRTIELLKQDGYPPLTEKLTVAMLLKMPPTEAEQILRAELRRTLKIDEETKQPIPDGATLKLIRDYMQWRQTP